MNVPFYDMRPANEACRSKIDAAMNRVLDNSWYILGDELKTFEQNFAQYCGAAHCIGVNSGTDALWLALLAAGVGPGDEVVTVAHTFVATAISIIKTGAVPVFADVDPETLLIDPESVKERITGSTKVILPVHLYGRCADLSSIIELGSKHGIDVIEDACQAHGAKVQGRCAGTFGKAGCFSFYPTKNLGALGDGGGIITDDHNFAERLRMLRNYGQSEKYHHDSLGYNSRLDELQSAILIEKLELLDEWNSERALLARLYRDRLCNVSAVKLLADANWPEHVYHLFVVRIVGDISRELVQSRLEDTGISSACHYPVPVHRHEAFAELDVHPGSLPVTEKIATEVLSLPLFPGMGTTDVDLVCDALVRALAA
jgi:dTDP-4-amino-4,6-dideoxygalactose transaminase